ncbi:MAG: hypothetical protein R3E60_06400 [Alphaproteobacteria bacterium]
MKRVARGRGWDLKNSQGFGSFPNQVTLRKLPEQRPGQRPGQRHENGSLKNLWVFTTSMFGTVAIYGGVAAGILLSL